ncbi:MAG: hypothetical protein AB8H80_19135 [Planctomycetota bacterium]
MAFFGQRGEIKFGVMITGPQHMMLGLVFGSTELEARVVEQQSGGGCRHASWDHGQLRAAVAEGLAGVAAAHRVVITAVEIHCLSGDAPSYELVSRCAYRIGERFAQGLEFEDMVG